MDLVSTQRVKELTDQQKSFLTALFGDAKGNPKKAGEIAGYSEHSYPKVIRALKDEIIQRAEEVMASYSPKATMGLVNALEEDGSTPNASIRVEAAKQILDRVGLTKKEKVDINVKSVSGIFILPPKDGERAENST
jgi:hypothetical protein|tara:strand:- start:2378 stop:2785 length:408 start_codon:yes stop_codon:yes gene_type:complete